MYTLLLDCVCIFTLNIARVVDARNSLTKQPESDLKWSLKLRFHKMMKYVRHNM